MVKALKHILFVTIAVLLVSVSVLLVWARDKYVVPILMYHNIEETEVRKANSVSPESFKRQMQYLRDHGYTVISLHDLVEGIRAGRPAPRKSVVITFDDAYLDNYTEAFPVLKSFAYPAIVFVPSDLVGTPGYVSWEQLMEMQAGGFVAGSHTRHHVYLPDAAVDKQREEIFQSKELLEKRLGEPVLYFAYPSGGFSDEIKDMVREAGYRGACATNRGYARFNEDVYELKRIRPNDDDSELELWAKLSGYYNLFRKSKHPF